jgi:hypothetical protein
VLYSWQLYITLEQAALRENIALTMRLLSIYYLALVLITLVVAVPQGKVLQPDGPDQCPFSLWENSQWKLGKGTRVAIIQEIMNAWGDFNRVKDFYRCFGYQVC